MNSNFYHTLIYNVYLIYNRQLILIEQMFNLFMLLFPKIKYHFMNKIIFILNIFSIVYSFTYSFS